MRDLQFSVARRGKALKRTTFNDAACTDRPT